MSIATRDAPVGLLIFEGMMRRLIEDQLNKEIEVAQTTEDEAVSKILKIVESQVRTRFRVMHDESSLIFAFKMYALKKHKTKEIHPDRRKKEYREWREAVLLRDSRACQRCRNKERLHAHHIKAFAKYPDLRFDVSNGVTLCELCHQQEHPHRVIIAKRAKGKSCRANQI